MRAIRLQQLRDFIFENEMVTFDDICEKFSISINTARRDVKVLTKDGSVIKVYGGVKANKATGLTPYKERNVSQLDQKLAIAKLAAEFIEDGDVIYMDPGTTVHNILDFIGNKQITVITASLDVIIKAAKLENVRLYTLCGGLNRDSNSFEDVGSYQYLEKFSIKKAFFACSGYSTDGGVMISSKWEFDMKKFVVKHNASSFLLIDNTKFSKTAMMKFAEANEINNIITCAPFEEKYIRFCKENGVNLYFADLPKKPTA